MKKSKTLVLGGTGFIGLNLLDRLCADGECVRILSRPSYSLGRLDPYRKKVEVVVGDFLDDSLLAECLQGVDRVYHLITTTFPSTAQKSAVYDINTNLVPTIRLVEECLKANVKSLVYASSGGTIYGEKKDSRITEEDPLKPISHYGQTKGVIESYLRFYSRVSPLQVKVLRISNPFGPRQKPFGVQGLVATTIQSVLKKSPLPVYGSMKTVRDYIYIDDVIDALMLISKKKGPDVVNISSGVGRSIRDIIQAVEKAAGQRVKINYALERQQDVRSNILSPELAWKAYGWRAKSNFDQAIQKTWDWYAGQTKMV